MKLKKETEYPHVQEEKEQDTAATVHKGQPVKFLRDRQVREILPVSRSTLWRWCRSGIFPKPVMLNNSKFWRSDLVAAWVDQQRGRN
jgi:predicted DNA-binding transcriptional regulator AlpA